MYDAGGRIFSHQGGKNGGRSRSDAWHKFQQSSRPHGLSGRIPRRPSLYFRKDRQVGKDAQGRSDGIASADEGRCGVDAGFRTFLPQSYNLKAIADYETGPGSDVSPERASDATQSAKRFVSYVGTLLLQP